MRTFSLVLFALTSLLSVAHADPLDDAYKAGRAVEITSGEEFVKVARFETRVYINYAVGTSNELLRDVDAVASEFAGRALILKISNDLRVKAELNMGSSHNRDPRVSSIVLLDRWKSKGEAELNSKESAADIAAHIRRFVTAIENERANADAAIAGFKSEESLDFSKLPPVTGVSKKIFKSARLRAHDFSTVFELENALELDELLADSANVPVVLDFNSRGCGPCIVLGRDLVKVAARYHGRIRIVSLNESKLPATAHEMTRMESVPLVKVYRSGNKTGGLILAGYSMAGDLVNLFAKIAAATSITAE